MPVLAVVAAMLLVLSAAGAIADRIGAAEQDPATRPVTATATAPRPPLCGRAA